MDRSWYNRAGVEHVMGYCTDIEYHRFLHQTPIFERMLVEDGIILLKYWFSVSDEEQEKRFHRPGGRPHAPLEAEPERRAVDHQVGGLLAREGHDVRAHRHPRGAMVGGRQRRQAARADQHDRAHPLAGPVRARRTRRRHRPAAPAVRRLRAPAARHDDARSRLLEGSREQRHKEERVDGSKSKRKREKDAAKIADREEAKDDK